MSYRAKKPHRPRYVQARRRGGIFLGRKRGEQFLLGLSEIAGLAGGWKRLAHVVIHGRRPKFQLAAVRVPPPDRFLPGTTLAERDLPSGPLLEFDDAAA